MSKRQVLLNAIGLALSARGIQHPAAAETFETQHNGRWSMNGATALLDGVPIAQALQQDATLLQAFKPSTVVELTAGEITARHQRGEKIDWNHTKLIEAPTAKPQQSEDGAVTLTEFVRRGYDRSKPQDLGVRLKG